MGILTEERVKINVSETAGENCCVAAWWVAYLIRFNLAIPPEFLPGFFLGLGIVVVLQGVLLQAFGLYRSLWVFASLPDLVCIGRAVAVATVLTPLVVVVAVRFAPEVPRRLNWGLGATP